MAVISPILERLLKSTYWDGPCWRWNGYREPDGYGRINVGGRPKEVHLAGWIELRGPVPEGMELVHTCPNRDCWNPEHLEPVSHQENCRRGNGWAGRNARKTHCKYGHPLAGDNLFLTKKGFRSCRACSRRNALAHYHRNKRLTG